jgi:integrase
MDTTTTAELTFVVAQELDDMLIDIRPDALPPATVPANLRPALVYLGGLLATSRVTMRSDLDTASRWLSAGSCDAETMPWWMLRRPHTNALRAWLLSTYQPATCNRILSAVRGALRTAWELELLSHEDMARACAVKSVKGGNSEPAGRALTDGEIAALLRVCRADPSPAGPRDAAIIGLGTYGTLRREEIARLPFEAYDAEAATMRVVGKGRKVRKVYLTAGLCVAIDEWLSLRGGHPGPLFLAIRKGGAILRSGISGAAVYGVLGKRAAEAGVKSVRPHDMRRTCITNMIDAGVDSITIADQSGHENVNMVARYDRGKDRRKRDAAGRLHMAWERRAIL